MSIVDVLFFTLVSFGITYGFTSSALLAPVRLALLTRAEPDMIEGRASVWTLGLTLIYCPYCIGFWAGVAVALFIAGSGVASFHHAIAWPFVVPGMISVVSAWDPNFLRGDFSGERRSIQAAAWAAGRDESEAGDSRGRSDTAE